MITTEMFESITVVADEKNMSFNDVLMACENTMIYFSPVKEIFEIDGEPQIIDKEIYDTVMSVYYHNCFNT